MQPPWSSRTRPTCAAMIRKLSGQSSCKISGSLDARRAHVYKRCRPPLRSPEAGHGSLLWPQVHNLIHRSDLGAVFQLSPALQLAAEHQNLCISGPGEASCNAPEVLPTASHSCEGAPARSCAFRVLGVAHFTVPRPRADGSNRDSRFARFSRADQLDDTPYTDLSSTACAMPLNKKDRMGNTELWQGLMMRASPAM